MEKTQEITTDTSSHEESPPDLMMAFLHAANSLQNRMEEAFEAIGLSTAKYGLLSKLAQAGKPLSLSELAALSSCVRSNMTQLVDRLEADGLVQRVADPKDRRIVLAELTTFGKEQEKAGAVQMKAVQDSFSASLSPVQRLTLQEMLF